MGVENKPRVTVSKSGVSQVSPAEILKSEAGRDQIKQTANALRIAKGSGATKSR